MQTIVLDLVHATGMYIPSLPLHRFNITLHLNCFHNRTDLIT